MSTIEVRQEQRRKFLHLLYQASGGSGSKRVMRFDIGERMGLARDQTNETVRYWLDKGMIKSDGLDGDIVLTTPGIDRVERERNQPGPNVVFPDYHDVVITAAPKQTAGPASALPTRPNTTAKQEMVHFIMPTGAHWGDVSILIKDREAASIRVKSVSRVCNYTQMGMASLTTSRPTRQWNLLVAFAESHGEIGWKNSRADDRVKKQKQELNDRLKAFFRLKGDAIVWDKGAKVYRCRFQIGTEYGAAL